MFALTAIQYSQSYAYQITTINQYITEEKTSFERQVINFTTQKHMFTLDIAIGASWTVSWMTIETFLSHSDRRVANVCTLSRVQ